MIRILGTVFAALLGLAFGSFLNVCLSRWPEGESIVRPRSHCRHCGHVLAWWENVPLVSWVALRGRCRGCGTWIGWRYVIVEAAVAGSWAIALTRVFPADPVVTVSFSPAALLHLLSVPVLCWLLVALAALDAEHLWLPDSLTLSGIAAGLLLTTVLELIAYHGDRPSRPWHALLSGVLSSLAAAAVILLIRWVYWLMRRREGIGLGDAKLMAMLAAWLGLPGALLAFALGVVLGAAVALMMLALPAARGRKQGLIKLPLGTFLCIGGIVSGLWGQSIIAAYLRWAGF